MGEEKLYWRVSDDTVYSCDYLAKNVDVFAISGARIKVFGNFVYVINSAKKGIVTAYNTTDNLTYNFSIPVAVSDGHHGMAVVQSTSVVSNGK